MATVHALQGRKIQDFSNVSTDTQLVRHWGYASRMLPCTNDPGSCAYLDLVYSAHDLGMIYSGIFWITIIAILLAWAVGRKVFQSTRPVDFSTSRDAESTKKRRHTVSFGARLRTSLSAMNRSYLLPNSIISIFGHTTRLQVTILMILSAYLTIWTFVGMTYETWVTPVKNMPGVYNTRTTLGPWSDRIGVLAYALTPLSVLLSSRESLLSVLTGVPYQSFMFLHRWVGYIIIIQSALHTIGWCVVEWRLYQPQPQVWNDFIKAPYIIWGCVGMVLLIIMFILTLPVTIRYTGYEFFRKAHYVLAMIYIGALIGHWAELQCFVIPGILLWAIDRAARLLRTGLLHYQYLPSGSMGFTPANAAITHFEDSDHGDIVRLDFKNSQEEWLIGQHFYLCFPQSSIWQSHPFTPLNVPVVDSKGMVEHSYIFRAKAGETKKIAQMAALAAGGEAKTKTTSTDVVLTGPYGQSIVDDLAPHTNVLCVAGGTGITFVLPVLLRLARDIPHVDRRIELVWAIRKESDLRWIKKELDELYGRAAARHGIKIHVFVTREAEAARSDAVVAEADKETVLESSASSDIEKPTAATSAAVGEATPRVSISHPESVRSASARRPDLNEIVGQFVDSVVRGPTTVFASGPVGMVGDLRDAVAARNSARKVWRGDEKADIRLECDDRIEL